MPGNSYPCFNQLRNPVNMSSSASNGGSGAAFMPGQGQSVSGKKSKVSDKDVDTKFATRGVWLVKVKFWPLTGD